MRVHSIEAVAVDIPLRRNFGGSTYLKRSTVITRMRTEGGLVSEIYNGDNREYGPEIVRLIHDELAPRVGGASICSCLFGLRAEGAPGRGARSRRGAARGRHGADAADDGILVPVGDDLETRTLTAGASSVPPDVGVR